MRIIPIAVATAFVCAFLGGCASTTETTAPEDPESAIRSTIDEMKAGLQAQDLDRVLAGYHENFDHPEYRNKAAIREFLREAYLLGYMNNIAIDDSQAQILRDGTRAEVYPIRVAGAFGALVVKLTLIESAGAWKVSWLDIEPA